MTKIIKLFGGKELISICITLTALAVSCVLLITFRTPHGQPGTRARERAHAAYVTFSKATSSFAARARKCQAPAHQLSCLKAADNQLAAAFTHLARTVTSIPVPDSAKYASADLAHAADQAAYSLGHLRTVRTLPQYREVWAAWPLLLDNVQVSHDYNYLQQVLRAQSPGAGPAQDIATGLPAHPDVTRIVLDGDNYDHGATIYSALQRLTQRCMSGRDNPYHQNIWEAAPPQTDAPLYINVTALRRDGYGLYNVVVASRKEKTSPAAPQDPNAAYLKSLTTAQRKQWNNALVSGPELAATIPDGGQATFQPGGCYAKSYDQIYGSYENWAALEAYASDLEAKVKTEALWSNGWISAQARWAHCLASGGFDYPTEAGVVYGITVAYQASGARLSRVHQLELRIARQDAACAESVRLNQAGRAAIGAAAATLPGDQLSALLSWQTMQARAYAAATKVLAAP